MPDILLFIFLLVMTGASIFLVVYFIITLSDLECDYLNSQQCCARLNAWVLPKMALHMFLIGILLLHSHWLLSLYNLPVAVWLFNEYFSVPYGNVGVYDPTEILNRGQLRKHMRDSIVLLACHLLSFFVYLYCLIIALLKGNPIPREYAEVSDM